MSEVLDSMLDRLASHKILFADDQIDVAETLASLLEPIGASVKFARDGYMALEAVKSEVFDLVVVDMKMPPGDWGGIWLIEQLSKGPCVPTIALSGQGGQEQTIQAHRAGVRDWVQKESALYELLDRVSHVLAEAEQKAFTSGLAALPTPVATAFQRVESAHTANIVLRLAYQAVETFLQLTSLTGLAEASNRGLRGPLSGVLGSNLARPSMGVWHGVVESLRKVLPKQSAFGELAGCINSREISSIVKMRNDIHHGVEPSESAARELLHPLKTMLGRLIARAVAYWSHVVFLPREMEYDTSGFIVRGPRLCGPSLSSQHELWRVQAPIHTGVPHLFSPDGAAFSLSPWFGVQESRTHGQWDTLLFEGVKSRNVRALVDTDPLLYSDIRQGIRHVSLAGGASVGVVRDWFGLSP